MGTVTIGQYGDAATVRLRSSKQSRNVAAFMPWMMATVYAFLLFSPFSVDIFSISKSYVFEVPLLLCILAGAVANDPIAKLVRLSITKQDGRLYIAAAIMLLLCFLGAFRGGNFLFAYADLRANLVVLLGFKVAFTARKTNRQADFLRLATMCTFLAVAYWFYSISTGAIISKYATCYMAAVVGVVICIELRWSGKMLLALGSLIFLAGVSFFRQDWIVAALTSLLVVHSVFTAFKGRARQRAVFLMLACCIAASAYGYTKLDKITKFFTGDQARYIQSVGKTNEAIDAVNGTREMSASDSLRMAYFTFIAEKPLELVLPHGLGYRAYIDNIDSYFARLGTTGVNTSDSLIFYIAFHYGLMLLLPLLAWLMISFRRLCKEKGIIPGVLLYAVLLIPGLFDGGQAVIIFRAFWLGSLVGMITYRTRFV